MTSFEVIQIAAAAQYRAMTDNDRCAFSGAHERTVIADVTYGNCYYIVLCSPAGEIEVYGNNEYECWSLTAKRMN